MLAGRPPSMHHQAGVDVAAVLAGSGLLPKNGVVALFASRGAELDTGPIDDLLRARGLLRAVPRISGDHLEFVVVDDDVPIHALPTDAHGIPTPDRGNAVPLASCGLVVVPGLGFDRRGGRLGYGRGYYDRALDGVADEIIVGVLEEAQWVDDVPMESHDRRLPRLASPAGLWVCSTT